MKRAVSCLMVFLMLLMIIPQAAFAVSMNYYETAAFLTSEMVAFLSLKSPDEWLKTEMDAAYMSVYMMAEYLYATDQKLADVWSVDKRSYVMRYNSNLYGVFETNDDGVLLITYDYKDEPDHIWVIDWEKGELDINDLINDLIAKTEGADFFMKNDPGSISLVVMILGVLSAK